MTINPFSMYPPGVPPGYLQRQQQQQQQQQEEEGDAPPSQQEMIRSYFVPNNLPTRPTDEEIQALEHYFTSHITHSTETLLTQPKSKSRPLSTGIPPSYLPTSQTRESGRKEEVEREEQGKRNRVKEGSGGFLKWFQGQGGLQQSNQREDYLLQQQAGDPTHFLGDQQLREPAFDQPYQPDHLHPESARFQNFPTDLHPSDRPPLLRDYQEDHTPSSLAPSQSLSQLAVRRARKNKTKIKRRASTSGGQGRRATGYFDRPTLPEVTRERKDEGVMDIESWARSSGNGQRGMRRTGGTNVDDAGGSRGSDSEAGGGEGQVGEGGVRAGSRAGTGWSQVYPESQLEGRDRGRRASSYIPTASHRDRYKQSLPPPPTSHRDQHDDRSGEVVSAAGWRSPEISEGQQDSEVASLMDRMTLGARSGMTGQTGLTGMRGLPYSSMGRMREALEDDLKEQQRVETRRNRHAEEKDHTLRRSHSQLNSLQATVRDLQARIIAEQVTRSETEREAMARAEEVRTYRDELAGAVRALRRAKDESHKLDEERRKGLRLFEETRERLVKLREAYKVQEAREAGRDEGRIEAFQEIERWMSNPPIPVEPMGYLNPGVLRQGTDRQPSGRQDVDNSHQTRPDNDTQPTAQTDHRPSDQGRVDSAERLYQQAQSIATQAHTNRQPSTSPHPGLHASQDPRPSPPGHMSMPPYSMAGGPGASSYLDWAEHDPRMQRMLYGAPQRTFTMPSQAPTRGHRSHAPDNLGPPDSASTLDKPLPSPGHHDPRQYRGSVLPNPTGHSRHPSQSVMGPPRDLLSPPTQSHNAHHEKSLSQADRYPPFPTHRTESILDHAVPLWPDSRGPQHMDPRSMHMPESRGQSEQGSRAPSRGVMAPSQATHRTAKSARSRLAAGLRGEEDPLSMIEEIDERETVGRHTPAPHRVPLPPSTAAGTHKTGRTMQSFMSGKQKPRPVMPVPLGMASTAMTSDNNLRGMYDADRASRHTATLPDPSNAYMPEGAYPMMLPSGQSPQPHFESMPSGPARTHAPTINVEPPSRQSLGLKGHPSTTHRRPSPSIIPADIPLPETRPGTMYEGASPHPHPHHSITAIDFAQRYPLPDSRPTTIMGRHSGGGERHLAATVEDVLDAEAAIMGRSAPLPSILKRDPGLSPLPPGSVRPGRRKTSTFVTIEEVARERR